MALFVSILIYLYLISGIQYLCAHRKRLPSALRRDGRAIFRMDLGLFRSDYGMVR